MDRQSIRKGKRAARESWEGQETEAPVPHSPPSSWSSRLASSASGLAQNILSRPDGTALSSYANAGVNGAPNKAGPSAAPLQSPWQDRTMTNNFASSSSTSFASPTDAAQGFRSTHTPSTADAYTIDDFLAGAPLTEQLAPIPAPPRPIPHRQVSTPRLACDFQRFHGKPVLESDGQIITSLLSRTDTAMDLDEPATQMAHAQEPTEQTAMDLFGPQNYTPQEQRVFDGIKAALPPPPQHVQMHPLNPTNLIPGVDDLVQSLDENEGRYLNYDTPTREHWLHEWDGVLNRYMDDVWSDMVPDIETVRTKLQAVAAKRDVLDSSAVSRLKMILGHMTQDLGSVDAHVAVENQTQDSDMTEVVQVPDFHCPWVDCNRRFHSLMELQQHSNSHRRLECPHVGCVANFSTREEWEEHFNLAHHDLLEQPRLAFRQANMEIKVGS